MTPRRDSIFRTIRKRPGDLKNTCFFYINNTKACFKRGILKHCFETFSLLVTDPNKFPLKASDRHEKMLPTYGPTRTASKKGSEMRCREEVGQVPQQVSVHANRRTVSRFITMGVTYRLGPSSGDVEKTHQKKKHNTMSLPIPVGPHQPENCEGKTCALRGTTCSHNTLLVGPTASKPGLCIPGCLTLGSQIKQSTRAFIGRNTPTFIWGFPFWGHLKGKGGNGAARGRMGRLSTSQVVLCSVK
jgi:hypothetical protein